MKKFAFRLESVLKLRRHEFERKQRAYLAARSRVDGIVREHEAAETDAAERAAAWITRAREGVVSERVGLEQFGIERAFVGWRDAGERLEEARAVAQQANTELTHAATRVRALETLRERALERYRTDALREEIRQLDEIAGRNTALARTGANR
ncbi:MAG: flagellar FliJ family protein [Myxococcota bacterium]|nr:flagellar FliJ family protein [Myxococcota bacterium]